MNSVKINAQQLYFEDFESCFVGNVGTDTKGMIEGQAGLLTKITGKLSGSNSDFRIENDPLRGNVLVIESGIRQKLKEKMERQVIKPKLDSLWNKRDTANNVLMYEYFIYTHKKIKQANWKVQTIASAVDGCKLSNIPFDGFTKKMEDLILPENSWIKVITYVDYRTNEIFHQIPSLNYDAQAKYRLSFFPIEEHKINKLTFTLLGNDEYEKGYLVKYDNIRVSAINSLPNFLNLNTINSSKFNIYPNPVNDIVTIINKENISVEEIIVYNLNGKMIQNVKFNQSTELQVDISHLKSGVYNLHLITNQGVVVEKIIKK